MKPLQLAVLGIILSLIVWGSLFLTVLNQAHQTHQLLKNDHQLLSQDTTILNAQKKTEADLEAKINSLQSHIDCLFNLATRPVGYRIADASNCTLVSSPPLPSSPTRKTTSTQSTPITNPAPAGRGSGPSTPKATSVESLPCTLTFGLLGC